LIERFVIPQTGEETYYPIEPPCKIERVFSTGELPDAAIILSVINTVGTEVPSALVPVSMTRVRSFPQSGQFIVSLLNPPGS
jgi:hypothetical protein